MRGQYQLILKYTQQDFHIRTISRNTYGERLIIYTLQGHGLNLDNQ